MILKKSFFDRPTLVVAENLIGCFLVRQQSNIAERYMVVETEAYDGPNDLACHASGGRRTKRTEVLFGKPGIIYIYFTYGIHWLLNFVAGPKDYPAGVLIRGVQGIKGPARLTKKLNLNGSFHGKEIGKKNGLWVESRDKDFDASKIKRDVRVGVDYAGPIWSKKKWRFILKTK